MEKQLQEIREQQKATWNKFSPFWKKWDDLTMEFLKPNEDKIIQILKIKETDVVLEIASGTGEPGLTIATLVKRGKVILTDLSEGMLEIALENASKRGVKNIETRVCDVCDLPFVDNTFDKVSCRFGFMFFADMLLAAKEMVRVLKPGGRIAISVWNIPEKNFWVTAIGSIIGKNMQLPAPPLEAPGMFRCAQSGLIADTFKQAGLNNISEIEVNGKLNAEPAEVYWNMMTEVAAPFVAACSITDGSGAPQILNDYSIVAAM